MVSYAPTVLATDFSHMYDFTDYRTTLEKKPLLQVGSIYWYLKSHPNFSRFSSVVDRAGMSGDLNELENTKGFGRVVYTLFAPTDDYLKGIPQEFFDKMDSGQARQIVKASLLERKIDKVLITSSPVSYFFTLNPEMRMYITNIVRPANVTSGNSTSGNLVTNVNECFSVTKFDINLLNGMIHIISGLIQPNFDHFMN